jgi:hypothetical protein
MPAANRFGPYEDAAPPVARQSPGERREKCPVSWPAVRPSNLPAQHSQLVTQDKDLDLVRGLRPATQHDQPDEMPKQPIQTGDDHPAILPAPSAATSNRVSGTHTFELRYFIADAGGLRRCDIDVLNQGLRRTLRNRGEYVRPIELVASRLTSPT